MKGSCKSLVELEFFLKEVYKETTDQLDWNNPEGQQYLHDLLKPLPLIPNSRVRHVIPFDHFINNDLEYLRDGVSSRKYTTSVTKTKAADYGHIKWIKDLAPRTMEYARDVYSKRRIIVVTELQIVEWHNYKHLDWITVRRDDDNLYKFKEGDFKRLRIKTLKTCCFFWFKESVKSYQKKLNLTKPDTYRSYLKCKKAYTAYFNPIGFIYQNKDKQNRLMCIDELHKFSDGTLNDVRIALDDHLKGIRMQYLPQTVWRRNTLTPELLVGLTYELMKGSCKSLVELEFFLKEVYKETTDQLDWNNPEGQQYLHDLLKPLPLIPNSRVRHVIPFDHFINNDLEYLRDGVSSRKYTTSVTKTKAADYGHIKWIKDLAPRTMEYARDVYSKRRIIVVTELQIVEWHNYKHLDWITVRRDDDNLYKFKEGDFKRLRIKTLKTCCFFWFKES
nr:hypothetical protein [Tanacetum cinerariifolium]